MPPKEMEPLLEYTQELFAPESEAQAWIRSEMQRRGFPMIHVSSLEGRILALLARLCGASRLLELGTLGGYSALWLVSLLPPEARLLTIESDPRHADLAREAFERAGETGRIRLLEGGARALLEEEILVVPENLGSFDLVFIDADKEGYPYYLEASCELLRPGGLLLGDNAFWEGRILQATARDPDTEAIRVFNRRLAADPRFEGVLLPVRDGLAVARFVGR